MKMPSSLEIERIQPHPQDSKQLIFLQLPAYKSNYFLTQYWESNTFILLL